MYSRDSHTFTKFFLLAICFLWILIPQTAPAQSFGELHYLTEDYYPFNYEEQGEVRGLSVDLLHQVWRRLGTMAQPIEVMPWARAYERIQHAPDTVLFSMARTPEREQMFKWAGPIMVVRFALIAKKERGLKLSSLDELKGYRVGTLREDVSDTILAPYAKQNTIESLANMEQNVRKIINDRLDMVAYEERAWQEMLIKYDQNPNDFETILTLKEIPIYYAFHRGTPSKLVSLFQQALDEIKATPVYQQILQKHL